MSYMKGIEPQEAGWITRLVYWLTRRKFRKLTGKARVIEPITVAAHHARLFRALGQMEGSARPPRTS